MDLTTNYLGLKLRSPLVVSASPLSEDVDNIKRMEDAGLILRRVTILNREQLGLGFEVYCSVKLTLPSKENLDAFDRAVQDWPEVVHCATVTGSADYQLHVITRDMRAFDDFERENMLSLGLISNIESHIVIRGVKDTTSIPLNLIHPAPEAAK
jgi:DNA-binding Lrp family transcriptional regulator